MRSAVGIPVVYGGEDVKSRKILGMVSFQVLYLEILYLGVK